MSVLFLQVFESECFFRSAEYGLMFIQVVKESGNVFIGLVGRCFFYRYVKYACYSYRFWKWYKRF